MKYILFAFLLSTANLLFSQDSESELILWEKPIEFSGNKALAFKNASYNSDFLPLILKNIKVPGNNYDVEIVNAVFSPLTQDELGIIDENSLSNSLNISSSVFNNRGVNYLSIEFIPLRINIKTQKIEKLISFQIKYDLNRKSTSGNSISNNVSNSALSSGNWIKLGVIQTGVHKVTYSQMVSYGLSSPSAPRVFGYGGQALSEYNNDFYFDDMNELAIKVEKGSDGVFNSGDYILFYAEGPQTWKYDETYQQFRHEQHNYSDTIFYYLSSNTGVSKNISDISQITDVATSINVFLDRAAYETDKVNLLHSGKEWFGEEFNSLNQAYSLSFKIPNLVIDSLVRINTFCAARSNGGSNVSISYNQELIQTISVPGVNLTSATSFFAREGSSFNTFKAYSPSLTLVASYDQYSQYTAWLNHLTINAVRQLKIDNEQLLFSNIYNINGVNQYKIDNANTNTIVWDVSDLSNNKRISPSYSNSAITFKDDANMIKTYAIFQEDKALSVVSSLKVKNQNLHALENIEYVILTHRNFRTQAEQIAEYHRNNSGLNTIVVSNEEIYNEFSSGTPDVTATKNFMRHLYHNRSNTDTLKYLMLFGDGSYDNKTISSSNSNFILTYQSDGSIKVNATQVSDDYYGLLDENEYLLNGYLDIGIGRIVVKTATEANNAVSKIINYSTSKESYGNWRSDINFIADNGDGNLHVKDADYISKLVQSSHPEFNINKIYMDAYPLEESSGGDLAPEATDAFNAAVNRGSLIVNYTGHGGELGLAHEQLTTVQDILSWDNSTKLPAFVTATCEFTRYDDKNRVSAGEYVFLNPNGGGIALFTTTRIAYAAPNRILNIAFYNQLFADRDFRMGDIIRRTKNSISATSSNMRIFTLIGDPALSLAVPEKKVSIDSITVSDQAPLQINNTDTFAISPLSKVTIVGKVTDENNQLLSNFNGIVYPTVFDKSDTVLTLCQYQCNDPYAFENRKNIIYKGKSTVSNGKFKFSFIVPKDISYKNGLGRISYYADNKSTDAWGYFDKLSISGDADTTNIDNKGPEIELFMNDENFIYGGTTDENPIFIASLMDENGINTVGNGIGHDLTAKLDNDNRKLSILNSHYEADIDSYQSGKVSYPYSKLEKGKHTLHFKAWDVFNNSSEQDLEFYVAESTELAIDHIFNYPNPFTTNTDFYFDHNQTNQNLEVLIQIFTVSGKLVKTIETNILTDGFRSTPINWNGKDDYEDLIGRGVYIYKLKVRTEDGDTVTEFQKLVILN